MKPYNGPCQKCGRYARPYAFVLAMWRCAGCQAKAIAEWNAIVATEGGGADEVIDH